jgi:hypothetical protein
MRLRSDERHQLFLLCKNDRKKFKLSKYLILSMRFENLKIYFIIFFEKI